MPSTELRTTSGPLRSDFEIVAEREINGVGMGVLNDGTPFLNLRGLARLCGVDHAQLIRITEEWTAAEPKPRVRRIKELVRDQGYDDTTAFIPVEKKGTLHHAIPDVVCMAILEYYAFDAQEIKDSARKSYRTLARKGMRDFIYSQVGYNPSGASDIAWRQFHDRVELTHSAVPEGHFCIFKEIAGIFVTMIKHGANPGKEFIPDISVGMAWSKYWVSENLEVVHGPRKKFSHHYPDYFPQAVSNPQEAYCYPDDAFGEFRSWLHKVYLKEKLPPYLSEKVRQGAIPSKFAAQALEAFQPRQITVHKR